MQSVQNGKMPSENVGDLCTYETCQFENFYCAVVKHLRVF